MTYDAAQKNGIEVVMCGEMAGDPINIPVLLGLGLTNLSMNSASIPVIKKMIRNMDFQQAGKNAKKLFEFQTTEETTAFIQEKYRKILPYRETEE